MNEERLAVEIRDAFDQDYEPNRGLEDRVVGAIPWATPRPRRLFRPRLAGAFVAAVAVITIVVLVAPTLLTRLHVTIPGLGPTPELPALSLASVSGDSLFVVQRGGAPVNALLQSPDGGRTWIDRLQFPGVYDGMQMYGQDGFIWSIDMGLNDCSTNGTQCHGPSQRLTLYRTWDGGATWTSLPDPGVPVRGVFFVDGLHGWIDSDSSTTGLGVGPDTLYASNDGGKSWTIVGTLPQSAPNSWVFGVGMYHVTFSRNSDGSFRGWYLGYQSLFTTADGGRSWQQVALAPSVPGQTAFPYQPVFSGSNGVLPVAYRDPTGPDNATANHLYFLITHDGGATWSAGRPAPTGFAPVGDILSIAAVNAQDIWLTSQSLTGGDNVQVGPAVARSTDAGLSWTVTQQPWRILQMTFRDATHGFALDVTGDYNVNGILSTSDGGETWQRVNMPVVG